MTDEIKEILEELLNMFELGELEEQVNNINKVLDYITNLQQNYERIYNENCKLREENERLKEDIIKWQDSWSIQNDKINKAIEYIKANCIDDEFYINLTNKEKAIIKVLNILQNGSDDNVSSRD